MMGANIQCGVDITGRYLYDLSQLGKTLFYKTLALTFVINGGLLFSIRTVYYTLCIVFCTLVFWYKS